MDISYESEELISRLEEHIQMFGGHSIVSTTIKLIGKQKIFLDFTDLPISDGKLHQSMTASALMVLLEKQNSIL